MRLQMGFLGIIEGFEQGTLVDRRTGITYIRHMEPYRADFLDKVRTMLITTAEPTINTIPALSCTIFTAKSRRLDLTAFSVFAGIE
jgi:hypothetical protein